MSDKKSESKKEFPQVEEEPQKNMYEKQYEEDLAEQERAKANNVIPGVGENEVPAFEPSAELPSMSLIKSRFHNDAEMVRVEISIKGWTMAQLLAQFDHAIARSNELNIELPDQKTQRQG